MKDTLRVLVGWDCNLQCSYCCNKIPEVRAGVTPAKLEDLDFSKYKTVCISGGEPLMHLARVRDVCRAAEREPFSDRQPLIVLYTNGTYLSRSVACSLASWGVNAINVGLHLPECFDHRINRVIEATIGYPLDVRFHVQDIHREKVAGYNPSAFRFWKMNDCARDNEDRVILEGL